MAQPTAASVASRCLLLSLRRPWLLQKPQWPNPKCTTHTPLLPQFTKTISATHSCTKKPNTMTFCTTAASSDAAEAASASAVADATSSKDDNDEKKIFEAAGLLDIRVGKILKAWKHHEADSLYVEEVDIGEEQPRVICSGLVKYIPLDQLLDRKVVVLANLKPRNMRGVKSSGMLMAASDSSHENVELLEPPADSLPGDRIWFGAEDEKENQPEAATPNQIQKKKIWESVQPHLKTDNSCVAILGTHIMRTPAGTVVSRSLKNANIS